MSLLSQLLARVHELPRRSSLSATVVEPDLRIVAAHVGEHGIEIPVAIQVAQANLDCFGILK
jgi:hypothetical protein